MNQIWNIFRKDVRNHRPEIAVSLALTVAFAWVEVREWDHQGMMAFGGGAFLYQLLSELIVPLLPASWMLLIVRAVHGESLVGDRQFWVTRPYDWKNLLAAKTLFVLAFVNLPLFIMDAFLLAKAGFRPSAYLSGLLWMQLLWILMLLIPTAALAAVTAGIGQMLLALFLVVLYMIAMSASSGAVPNSGFSSDVAPVYFLLVIGMALAVIFLQYSSRKATVSRWMIAGLAPVFALIMIFAPYRTLIAREFPISSNGQLPLHVAMLPSRAPAPEYAVNMGNSIPLRLPLSLSGLPSDSFVELKGVILTLTNSQGARWDSGWQGRDMLLFPSEKTANIEVRLGQEDFEHMKSSPVNIRLLLAFTLLRDKNQRQFVVPNGGFAFPDLGLCSVQTNSWSHLVPRNLVCRLPLRRPSFLLITTQTAQSTCPLPKNQTPPVSGETVWEFFHNDSEPADPGISPVKILGLSLSNTNPSGRSDPGICPGTPLTLSNPEEAGKNRLEVQLDNVSLADYQQSSAPLTTESH